MTQPRSCCVLLQCRGHQLELSLNCPWSFLFFPSSPPSPSYPQTLWSSLCVMTATPWVTLTWEIGTPSFRKSKCPAQSHADQKWQCWDLTQVVSSKPTACPFAGNTLDTMLSGMVTALCAPGNKIPQHITEEWTELALVGLLEGRRFRVRHTDGIWSLGNGHMNSHKQGMTVAHSRAVGEGREPASKAVGDRDLEEKRRIKYPNRQEPEVQEIISVSSGCYNKIPQTRGLKQ